MKITQDVRDYAATLGVAEEQALERGMEEKSAGVPERRARRSTGRSEAALETQRQLWTVNKRSYA